MSVVISGFLETDKESSYLLLVPNAKVLIGISLKETSNNCYIVFINNLVELKNP